MKTLKVTTLFSIFFFLAMYAYGFIVLNETGCTYEGECPEGESATTQLLQIRPLIISAAGNLLEASCNYRLFLSKVEFSQTVEAKEKLNGAINRMVKANSKYIELVTTASNIPYNEKYIESLKNFNYDEFQTRHNLNTVIFNDLKVYLKEGKITELYKRFSSDTTTLIILLFKVKGVIDSDALKLTDLIDIEQKISTLILMGQYATQVFLELK